MASKFNVGRNVEVTVEGKTMTIKIDLSQPGVLSGSAKNMTLATTGSPQSVGSTPDGRPVKLSLSAFAPPSA